MGDVILVSIAIITNINHTSNNKNVNLYAAIGKTIGAGTSRLPEDTDGVSLLKMAVIRNSCFL